LKKQCINPNDNSFERKFLLGNTAHTFGMGGKVYAAVKLGKINENRK